MIGFVFSMFQSCGLHWHLSKVDIVKYGTPERTWWLLGEYVESVCGRATSTASDTITLFPNTEFKAALICISAFLYPGHYFSEVGFPHTINKNCRPAHTHSLLPSPINSPHMLTRHKSAFLARLQPLSLSHALFTQFTLHHRMLPIHWFQWGWCGCLYLKIQK